MSDGSMKRNLESVGDGPRARDRLGEAGVSVMIEARRNPGAVRMERMRRWTTQAIEWGRDLRHPLRRSVHALAAREADPKTESDLQAIQRAALAALLGHAKRTIPFYRDRLPGAREIERQPHDTLQNLPILRKNDLIDAGHAIESNDPGSPVHASHTGGSTGVLLTFKIDEACWMWSEAIRKLCFRWCGYAPGAKQVFLWGADADVALHQRFRTRVADALTHTRWINTFDLDDERFDAAIRALERWKPEFIWGYASSVATLARRVERLGADLKPRAVQTTAEVLYPEQRALIERALGCPVFDRYGSRESNIIAHECQAHDGLHVLGTSHYVEVVDDDGGPVEEGRPGRIVITSLRNRAQGFIRYDTGDLGTWTATPCACGRPGVRLRNLVGREVDTIHSPSGKKIHGEFFTHLLYGFEGVRQFQVVQKTHADLTLRVVPADRNERPSMTSIIEKIQRHGDPGFRVTVEWVERIPILPSGKRRFVVSELTETPVAPAEAAS